MAEKQIFINSGEILIEGLFDNQPGEKAVVVTHPHPLYGGDMNNNVVEAIIQAYHDKGFSTLRINFRGIGQSQGNFDNGIGEQDDIKAAISYLSTNGKKQIDLAGYSFGAWVSALGLETFEKVNRLIMISPPVNFIDFTFLTSNPKIKLVITGSEDDIAGLDVIKGMLPSWNPEVEFKTIHGADHFYGGQTGKIISILNQFLDS